MNEKKKNILLTSVICDKFEDFRNKFKRHKLSLRDNSFFDYDLLKAALARQDERIANFLLERGCRVRNPSKVNSQESPLHLAMIWNSSSIITKILKSGASIYDKNYKGETPLYLAFKEIYLNTFPSWEYLDSAIDTVFDYYCSEDNEQSNSSLVSVDPANKDDMLHFHIACINNNVNAVQLYLKNGFDVNSPFSFASAKFNGLYPLHYAAMKKHIKLFECLVQHGADISIPNNEGDTALHILHNLDRVAVNENQDMVSQVKVKKNTELILKELSLGTHGISHFHLCCTTSGSNRVQAFLESGVEVDSCIKSGSFAGCTALHIAVLYNQRDVVEILLKWHAHVNIKTSEQQLTPLHVICNYFNMKFLEISKPKRRNIYVIRCCIFRRPSVERTSQNEDINWRSEHNNQLKIIELLLLHGADVNAKDSAGITPLLYTFMSPEEQEVSLSSCKWDLDQINSQLKKIVQILFSKGANMNALTHSQESIMHIISQNSYLRNSEELLEFCVNKGADIHAADVDGFTPLHVAVKSKSKMCVEFLLKHGVNVDIKSKDFKIPLNFILNFGLHGYSFLNDENEILLLLLKYGSDVNFRYENDKILWLDALEKCGCSIVGNLLNYVDINMKDTQGNPLIVSVLSKWLNHTYEEAKNVVFCIIFSHIQKLVAAGFYVNVKVKRCCNKLHQYYKNLLNRNLLDENFSNNCIKELSRMKLIKVGNCISLYNILLKDIHELSKQVKSNALVNILEGKNFVGNFPLYSSLLKARFNKGRKRIDVLKSANHALCALIGFDLPDLCLDLILKHLTNEEIANLKTATSKTSTNKKKINDFTKTKPSTSCKRRRKMQKC